MSASVKFGALLFLFAAVFCLPEVQINSSMAQTEEAYPPPERPLSLEECIRLAIDNSFEIKLARLDFLIAETDLTLAEAVFDTSLFGNIGYQNDQRDQVSIFGPKQTTNNIYSAGISKKIPSGTELKLSFSSDRSWSDSAYVLRNPAYETDASVEMRQPVWNNYLGSNDRRNITSTRLAIQSAGLDTKERIESLFENVEKAYWELAFAGKNLDIYKELLEKAEELHKTNTRNYDMGRIEKGDFLASEANVIIRKKDLAVAGNNYRRTEENLKLLINTDASWRILPSQELSHNGEKLDLAGCLKKAFQVRRDYQKAKTELERQKIILKVKSNERWPEIDLVASMTANGVDSEFNKALNRTGTGNAYYYAGVEVNIPIENRAGKAGFNKAAHNKEKAIISLKELERGIITEIGNLFRDYLMCENNVESLRQVEELQGAKLKEEEKKFEYGRSATKTLIDYQQDYLNARAQLTQEILNAKTAGINLNKALNIIFEKYEGML